MISSDCLLVGGWHTSFACAFSSLLLLLWLRHSHAVSSPIASGLLLPLRRPLSPQLLLIGILANIVIRDSSILALILGNCLVVVVRLWVQGNDIPSVQQTGKVAKSAEQNVYEGIRSTDAGFDPPVSSVSLNNIAVASIKPLGVEARYIHGDWGKEDGEDAEEDVA